MQEAGWHSSTLSRTPSSSAFSAVPDRKSLWTLRCSQNPAFDASCAPGHRMQQDGGGWMCVPDRKSDG